MKIVFVSQSYYPQPGGVTEHVHHVVRELRRRGHDVTILTSRFRRRSPAEVGVVRVGRNMLVPVNGAWVNMTVGSTLVRDVREVLRSLSPDVVHTHCPLAPSLPLIALKTAPSHTRIVGTFHAAASSSIGYQLFREPLRRWAERIDCRVAVSQAAVDLARRYFPGRYTVIPNGVDCDRFTPNVRPLRELRDGAFNVLFVGRLDRRKGLKYLCHAMNIAARTTSRRLRLIVVGNDGLRRRLLPPIADGVDVVFAGVVDRAFLPRYFASADAFCSPATDRESFGIVLLEAMATGVPVIGTAIPGYLTVLQDGANAAVVPPRDATAIAKAIVRLVEDPSLARALATGGRTFVQRYRWERVVDRLVQVYDDRTAPGAQEQASRAATIALSGNSTWLGEVSLSHTAPPVGGRSDRRADRLENV